MKIIIYDIEVLPDDWIVVARKIGKDGFIVVHNDNHAARELFEDSQAVFGGFNNKHYDDWVVLTMLLGGSNVEVKRHNDFIINGGNGWEFPFVQYKKKPFRSFDLRDDIADKGLSLKAIEGNIGSSIVESSIPFDIDRKLTESELQELIHYCKHDVSETVKLYQCRFDYLKNKRLVGKMYGIDEYTAMGLTNAKLSALVLGAKFEKRNDERDYKIPTCIDTDSIPGIVLKFFAQLHDETIPNEVLFSKKLDFTLATDSGKCPVTCSWGGIHGAKPCVNIEADENRAIVNWDVASLYPNSMINFGFCSRSMADPKAYEKLVKRRLKAKHEGDKDTANALKLVINTVYGAMLNQYNALYDPLMGRSVCITNQLAMLMLITMLSRKCRTIDFININTDGIMFSIERGEDATATAIVNDWCGTTGFEMERDEFARIVQKDVNNYIGVQPDGHIKHKGGYVSLYDDGSLYSHGALFKMDSLQIVHQAIVEYFINGADPSETIRNCTDVHAFQQIVKTGSIYDGTFQYIDGKPVEVQKVNRIFAVDGEKYPGHGKIVKVKLIREKRRKNRETGKMEVFEVNPPIKQETVISECPKFCFIDEENELTVDSLDLNYYIEMARNRIDKFMTVEGKSRKELETNMEVRIMASQSTNIYQKLNEARKRFAESNVTKSGVNTYAEFKYFTLNDIVPVKNRIFNELGLVDIVEFYDEAASLTIFDVENPESTICFQSPLAEDESLIKNPIQKLGAVQTYIRRYLYVNALDIVEPEIVDAISGKADNRKPNPAKREEAKATLTNGDDKATKTQLTSLKKGLEKLRESQTDNEHETYIAHTVKLIKSGITKKDADALLIEIGEKVG